MAIIRTSHQGGRAARASEERAERKAKEEVARNAIGLYRLEIELKETLTLSSLIIAINSV